jgi:DNA helicase HerA-like ATPase
MSAAIQELAVGEALVSLLDAKGRPGVTERVYVLPPGSQIGPITPAQRQALIAGSLVAGTYEKTVDRESAYEMLRGRAATEVPAAAGGPAAGTSAGAGAGAAADAGMMGMVKDMMLGTTGPRGGRRPGLVEAAASSAVRTIGSTVGRELIRGVLGSLLGSSRRR